MKTVAEPVRDAEYRKRVQSLPMTDRPLAAEGLKSYRAKGEYGWIMIGAEDDSDAVRQGQRSTTKRLTLSDIERFDWESWKYVPVRQ